MFRFQQNIKIKTKETREKLQRKCKNPFQIKTFWGFSLVNGGQHGIFTPRKKKYIYLIGHSGPIRQEKRTLSLPPLVFSPEAKAPLKPKLPFPCIFSGDGGLCRRSTPSQLASLPFFLFLLLPLPWLFSLSFFISLPWLPISDLIN